MMSKSRPTSVVNSAVVMRDHCLGNTQENPQENFNYTLVRFATTPRIYSSKRKWLGDFIVVVDFFKLFFSSFLNGMEKWGGCW